jgi:hypothetical protein
MVFAFIDVPRLFAGHMARIERSKQMAESQKGVGTDAITAIIAAILALANALDKKGTLSFEEYRDALLSMYREMPHEDARGDAVTYSTACCLSSRAR